MTVHSPAKKVSLIKWYFAENPLLDCVDSFSVAYENRPESCQKTMSNIVRD